MRLRTRLRHKTFPTRVLLGPRPSTRPFRASWQFTNLPHFLLYFLHLLLSLFATPFRQIPLPRFRSTRLDQSPLLCPRPWPLPFPWANAADGITIASNKAATAPKINLFWFIECLIGFSCLMIARYLLRHSNSFSGERCGFPRFNYNLCASRRIRAPFEGLGHVNVAFRPLFTGATA